MAATVARQQGAFGFTASTSFTANISATTIGQRLIVFIAGTSTSVEVTGVTSASGTWTRLARFNANNAGHVEAWECLDASASITSISWTISASHKSSMILFEIANSDMEVAASAVSGTDQTDDVTQDCGPITPPAGEWLLLAGISTNATGTRSVVSISPDWSTPIYQTSSTTVAFVGASTRTVTGDGITPYSVTFTLNGAEANCWIILRVPEGTGSGDFHLTLPTALSIADESYTYAVLTDQPVSHWRLGESSGTTAFDTGSAGADGVYTGGPALAQPGLINDSPSTAVSFDGSDDRVLTTLSAAHDITGDITVEVWVRPAEVSAFRKAILAKGTSSIIAEGIQYQLDISTTNRFTFSVAVGTVVYSVTANAVVPNLAKASHVVGRRIGTELAIFVDGQKFVSSVPVEGAINTTVGRLAIAQFGESTSTTTRFHGEIDEPAVYASGLSDNRIEAHYLAGLNPEVPRAIIPAFANVFVDLSGLPFYEQAVLDDTPVSFWRFGEVAPATEAADSGPAFTPGQIDEAGVTLGVQGALPWDDNPAFRFDGVTGRVLVPANAVHDFTGDFTLEAWIKPSSVASIEKAIIAKGGSSTNDADKQYALFINNDNRYELEVQIAGVRHGFVVGSIVPSQAAPTHIVGRRSGGELAIFINGSKFASEVDVQGSLQVTSGPLAIGSWGSSTTVTRRFHGMIDEPAVYNYALPDDRINAHYQAAINPPIERATIPILLNVYARPALLAIISPPVTRNRLGPVDTVITPPVTDTGTTWVIEAGGSVAAQIGAEAEVDLFDAARTIHSIGDIHVSQTKTLPTRREFVRADMVDNNMNAKAAHLVFTGDLTDDATPTQINEAKAWLESLGRPYSMIGGNHDFYNGVSMATFEATWGTDANWKHDIGNDIRLIGVTTNSFNTSPIVLNQETLDFLDAALGETTRNCVVYAHSSLYGSVLADPLYPLSVSTTGNSRYVHPRFSIEDILNRHPNARAWIGGHTHSSITSPNLIMTGYALANGTIMAINHSSIGYPGRGPDEFERPIASLYLTVYTDRVEARMRDHREQGWHVIADELVHVHMYDRWLP